MCSVFEHFLFPPSVLSSPQVKVQELKDDDEDAEEDSEEAEEEESPNFIAMIDKVLSKVDPAKFLTMVEKLNDALPPPGQTVFKPLIDALQQACENKAKLQVCLVACQFILYACRLQPRVHAYAGSARN